jgi:6-phosphofructokinase 1
MQQVDKYVILQTVGRDTGWLAASAALAKKNESDAPHLIYIPERPLYKKRFIADVKECIKKYGWVSIICGEGILWEDKSFVASLQVQDISRRRRFRHYDFNSSNQFFSLPG